MRVKFLNILLMNSLNHRKSGPIKTGPAWLAPTPMSQLILLYIASSERFTLPSEHSGGIVIRNNSYYG